MRRKSDAEIRIRIAELEERREGLSTSKRMNSEGLGIAIRISELLWTMGD